MSDGNETRIVVTADGANAQATLAQVATELKQFQSRTDDAAASMASASKRTDEFLKNWQRTNNVDTSGFIDKIKDFRTQWSGFVTDINQGSDLIGKCLARVNDAYEFSRASAKLNDMRQNFGAFAISMGADAQKIMPALREASKNTINDSSLMLSSNKAMLLGVTRDADTMAKLMEAAIFRGKLMGRTSQEAFDDIVTGVGRMSPLILDNLGIVIKGFDKLSEGMSDTEKKSKLVEMVLADHAKTMSTLGGKVATSSDAFERLDVAMGRLKSSFSGLADVSVPVVDFLASAANAAARLNKSVIDLPANLAKLTGSVLHGNTTPGLGLTAEDRQVEVRGKISELQTRISGGGAPDTIQTWKNQLHDLRLELNVLDKDISANVAKRSQQAADDAKKKMEKELESYFPSTEELQKAEENFKREQKKLDKESASAQRDAQKGANEEAKAFERVAAEMQKISGDTAGAFYDAMGDKVIKSAKEATKVLYAATAAVGGFSFGLKDGVTEYGKISDAMDKASEKGRNIALQATYGAAGGGSQKRTYVSIEEEQYRDTMDKAKEAEEAFRKKFEINIADSFETGLYRGLSEGNFLKTLEEEFTDSIAKAVAAGFTQQWFGGSNGTVNVQSMLFGGGTSVISSSIGPNDVAVDGNNSYSASSAGGAGSSGSGLLSGLFKPVMSGSSINWGNLASNVGTGVVVSAVVDRLTGTGGIFSGSRVQHGTEAITQASDINSRVTEAMQNRTALLTSSSGASKSTLEELKQLQFWTAGYTASNSGDGVFSKKTTTYALDATKANEALTEFSAIVEKLNVEIAERSWEKALATDAAAAAMSLNDLKTSLDNAVVGTEEYYNIQAEIASASKQSITDILTKSSTAFDFMINNIYAKSGLSTDAYNSLYSTASSFGSGTSITGTITLDNGQKVSAAEYLQLKQQQSMIPGLKSQAETSYQLQYDSILAGDDTEKQIAVLDRQKELITDSLDSLKELMDAAEAKASDATATLEQQNLAFTEFQSALSSYYTNALQVAEIEAQQKALLEKKQSTLTSDILGTLLTRVGEISDSGGKVIVLNGGTVSAAAMIQKLKDAYAGTNPELATILDAFVSSTSEAAFWGMS